MSRVPVQLDLFIDLLVDAVVQEARAEEAGGPARRVGGDEGGDADVRDRSRGES